MSYSWDPRVESYRTYLSRKDYLGEITGSMGRASEEIRRGIDDQTASILGSNDRMAELISSDLSALRGEISAGLSELSASFNWGFSQMLLAMGGMTATIQELVKIAKTPAQTAAFEHFENARENYRKGLLEECIEELDKAISGDHVSSGYKTEWRFHQLLGIVRLGRFGQAVPEVMDEARAEEAFLLAARYSRADEPREAAKALMSAGFAAYAQSPGQPEKLKEALAHTEAALALDSGLSEAVFQASKLHMAIGCAIAQTSSGLHREGYLCCGHPAAPHLKCASASFAS